MRRLIDKLDTEQPLFLHFLNREACESCNAEISEANDISNIEVLLLCHCGRFSVNISQMIEYSYSKKRLLTILQHLAKSGVIITTSSDADIDQFLKSRQEIYSSVSARYPMYFRDTGTVEKFKIAAPNSFSMTPALHSIIVNSDPSEPGFEFSWVRHKDKTIFRDKKTIIEKAAFQVKGLAVTKDVIASALRGESASSEVIEPLGRVISALYFEQYRQKNMVLMPTGLGLSGYKEQAEYFPFFDIIVLRELLFTLGYRRPKKMQKDFFANLLFFMRYGSTGL